MLRTRKLILSLAVMTVASQAMAVDYSWNGGTGGWNLAGNWTPSGIPNAATDNVVIDDVTAVEAIVNLPGSATYTVGNLTIAANTNGGTNTLNIPNNTYFNIANSLTNHGLLSINAGGSLTQLIASGPSGLSITGTGTVRLVGNNSRVSGTSLTNGTGHTIGGYGNLGTNTLAITNNGTISANVSAQTLIIDPTTFTNAGTLNSLNGGTLALYDGTYTNTGTINAGIGSTVSLRGVTLSGGQLTSTGTGTIQLIGSETATLSGITLGGQFNIQNAAWLQVQNTITNNATLTVAAQGSQTNVRLVGNATLAGSGDLNLAGTNARVTSNGAFTLTNSANHLIHGVGNVGTNTLAVVNNGTIRADAAGQTLNIDPGNLNIDANGSDFINNGQFGAAAGAILALHDGDYTNNTSIVADGTDARVRLNEGARITGGIVRGINGGKVVGVSGNNLGLNNVTVEGIFEAENNTDLEFRGTITNNGTISILAGPSLTDVELNENVSLNGSGTLRLAGTNAGVNTQGGTHTLTQSATHTLAGYGRLGQNVTGFINDGTIVADVSGSALNLDPANVDVDGAGADLLNRNLIRATAGGIISLHDGDYVNTASGVIEATGAGSSVVLNDNARLAGGIVRGVSGGVVNIAGSVNAGFKDLTVQGDVAVSNNSDLELRGTITNNGTIRVNAGGSLTDLELNGNVTLAGTGQVALDGGNANSGINGTTDSILTNAATHTIRGHGRLGQDAIGIINNGIIRGDSTTGVLTVDPSNAVSLDADASHLVNNNLIQASGGGSINLANANYRNSANGVIEATGTNSAVRLLEGARLTGGKVRGVSGGVVYINGSANAGFRDLTIEGDVVTENNVDLEFRGTITNNGTVSVVAGGSLTDIELNSDVTVNGNGRINLGGSINSGINGAGGTWTLTNAAGHTIAGKGNIGRDTIRIVNNGVIQADQSGQTLTIDPSATVGGNYGFVNNNTVAAINGGRLLLVGGDFYNDGLVRVDPGASLNIASSANFIHAPNSTLIQSGDVVIESGGTFTNAGIFSPANVGTAGTVTMTGTFVNAPTGRLIVDIAGTTPISQHDQIVGNGSTQLAGTLEINLLAGFEPAMYGTPIVIIRDNSGSNITGRFSQILNFDLGPTKKLAVIYSPSGATANQVSIVAARPGDANVDGSVNFDDLLALAQNYNSANPTSWQRGDFSGDGLTNFDDLLTLAQNYGFTSLSSGDFAMLEADFAADWALAVSMVPEPTSLSVLALSGALMLRRRR